MLILAVNLPREADTIGAVAGGIAGSAWDRQALPARWLAVLHQREYIERTAEQLSRQRGRNQGSEGCDDRCYVRG